MNNLWPSELTRIGVIAAIALVAGAAIGYPKIALSIALLLYLLWHLSQAIRVYQWLADPGDTPVPGEIGVWSEIAGLLHRWRRDHELETDQLRKALERYSEATRALPDGAVTLGPDNSIEFVNDAATRLLDLKETEDLGQPITNLVRDPELTHYLEQCDFTDALEIVHENVPLAIRVVPFGEIGRKLMLVRDLTRLRRLENIRRDFVANVSHEMKSPLTVIKGYIESMTDDTGLTKSAWQKPISQISQQTDRMCYIVEDLLQLSNLESAPDSLRPLPVDVPALVHSVCAEAAELDSKKHKLVQQVDEGLCLTGNFNELYSAFSNIVFNAITYTPAEGSIEVAWFSDDSGRPCFRVTDTGIGIAPQHISRLTERFYRVDQARSRELGGTGLGLAIVKHVLIRHGADLVIRSTPGKGSTFTCVFPQRAAQGREQLKVSA